MGEESYRISAQEVSQITAILVIQRTTLNRNLESIKAAHHRLEFHKLGEARLQGQLTASLKLIVKLQSQRVPQVFLKASSILHYMKHNFL